MALHRLLAILLAASFGAAVATLVRPKKTPETPAAPPIPAPTDDDRAVPWIAIVLAVLCTGIALVLWFRGGSDPRSEPTDQVSILMPDSVTPRAFWQIDADTSAPYTLATVELVIFDHGSVRSNPVDVIFSGAIANGVLACRNGPDDEGIYPRITGSRYLPGEETPVPQEEVEAAAAAGKVRSTSYSTEYLFQRITCTIDPTYVFSSDYPDRHFAFPPIYLIPGEFASPPENQAEQLNAYSSAFRRGETTELAADVQIGSFTVPSEAEARSAEVLFAGVLLGASGGFLTSVVNYIEWLQRKRRAARRA